MPELNQKHLYEDIEHLFKHATPDNFDVDGFDQAETVEKGHGRIEKRVAYVITHDDWLDYLRGRHRWAALKTVTKVVRTRTQAGKTSTETQYYIGSRLLSAIDTLATVRAHWGVENSVHWVLDVIFNEDNSRVRTGHAQQNLALMRRIAINFLNRETSRKDSLKGKRQLGHFTKINIQSKIE